MRSTVLCTLSVVLPVPNFSAIVRFVCKRLNFIFPRNECLRKVEICLKLSEIEIPQKSPLGQWKQKLVQHRDLREIVIFI